jgi:hypothetical protein
MTDHFKAVLTGADPANCVNNLQMGSATHFDSVNVTLEGVRASAVATNSNQTVHYTLMKSGGSWLIDGQGDAQSAQTSSSSGGGSSSP